jgi:tetratricopeptide (TPR) repeat protein
VDDSSKAIELDILNWPAYANRGFAHLWRNELRAAVSDFGTALRIKPDEPVVLAGRAEASAKLGQAALAMNDAEKALQFEPDLPEAYYARGLAEAHDGQTAAAIADVQKALSGLDEPANDEPDAFKARHQEIVTFLDDLRAR